MLEASLFNDYIDSSMLPFIVDFGYNYAKMAQRADEFLAQNRLFNYNIESLQNDCLSIMGALRCYMNIDYGTQFAIQLQTLNLDT